MLISGPLLPPASNHLKQRQYSFPTAWTVAMLAWQLNAFPKGFAMGAEAVHAQGVHAGGMEGRRFGNSCTEPNCTRLHSTAPNCTQLHPTRQSTNRNRNQPQPPSPPAPRRRLFDGLPQDARQLRRAGGNFTVLLSKFTLTQGTPKLTPASNLLNDLSPQTATPTDIRPNRHPPQPPGRQPDRLPGQLGHRRRLVGVAL
jgi:hypothetical protein